MSRPWYAAALPDHDDAAWELYHENSKRVPGEALTKPRRPVRPFPYAGLPALEPAAAEPPRPPNIAAGQLLSLLASGSGSPGVDDAVLLFVYIAAVAGLAPALAVHDPTGPRLRLVATDVDFAEVAAVLPDAALAGAAAIVFLAADLEAATLEAGERGYRNALIDTGRRLAALESAPPPGVAVRPVEFHDRAADALLYLDGLSQSVLAALAVGAVDG